MAWVKRNLGLVIGGVIALALLGVAGFYFWGNYKHDQEITTQLDETTEKWGLENALRDVVRVIRMTRPWIVLSRFQGNARDGHGNHSAAGLLSQQASEAAGDPNRFPEQVKEGLRPWQGSCPD